MALTGAMSPQSGETSTNRGYGGSVRRWRSRLWKPHAGLPFSSVVSPPAVALDVVDLAVLGGEVAEVMEALPVPHLHGPAGGACEQASAHAHVDGPPGPLEDHPLQPGRIQVGKQAPRGDHGQVAAHGDPRRRRASPVALPGAPGVEGG